MKPAFESLTPSSQASFLVRKFEEPAFAAPYHFHPEYELTLILKGCGKRYVGTHMNDYGPGDLVLLGSNLPHCWKTERASTEPSVSVVIQFDKNFLGPEFFQKPELDVIRQLLDNSRYGLQFTGDTTGVKNKMLDLLQQAELFKKLMSFLDVLHELAVAATHTRLDKQCAYSNLSGPEKERIHAVMAYIVDHFQTRICLHEAAAAANLTPPAFCRYFKKATRKTFIEAVNDYRVDFAVQQLVHTGKAVTQIGFDSGFEDLSNFYRTFKQRLGCSPLQYRQTFVKQLA